MAASKKSRVVVFAVLAVLAAVCCASCLYPAWLAAREVKRIQMCVDDNPKCSSCLEANVSDCAEECDACAIRHPIETM